MGSYDFSFPSGKFTVDGNPSAIRASAAPYRSFTTTASSAASSLRSLSSGGWIGDEGDLFRQKSAPLPAPLETASDAFGQVTLALLGFADALEACQSRMSTESSSALAAWNRLRSAQADVKAHEATASSTTFATPADKAAFDSQGTSLQRTASSAQSDWGTHLSAAAAIRSSAQDAAHQAAQKIRGAAKLSPTAGQNWFSRHLERAGNWIDEHGAGVRTWIGEHANVIHAIGTVMSVVGKVLFAIGAVVATICTVAGFFTFGVGFLGDIPAGLLMTVGGGLWMAGDAVQDVADWGSGKIDGQQLIVDGLFIVGGTLAGLGIGKIIGKGAEALSPLIKDWLETGGGSTLREWLERRGISFPTPPESPVPGVRGPGEPVAGGATPDPVVPEPPNTVTRTSGQNVATFTTDPQTSLVTKVEATLKEDMGGTPRSKVERDAKKALGPLPTGDQAGHIVAHRFLQDAGVVNLYPQEANFNTSAWKTVENEWADWIDKGMEVKPTIEFTYPNGSTRPAELHLRYDVVDPVSGDKVWSLNDIFQNDANQTFDRVYKEQMDVLIAQAGG